MIVTQLAGGRGAGTFEATLLDGGTAPLGGGSPRVVEGEIGDSGGSGFLGACIPELIGVPGHLTWGGEMLGGKVLSNILRHFFQKDFMKK